MTASRSQSSNHPIMVLLRIRATVLFTLVASAAVLTQTAPASFDTAGHGTNDDFPNNDFTLSETSSVPNCSAYYVNLDASQPKVHQTSSVLPKPFAICVNRANGEFVATKWSTDTPYTYMLEKCGWIKKKIHLPAGTSTNNGGCAFTGTKLFYADTESDRILQFTIDGDYEKVFATGFAFLRMTTHDNLLYSSILLTKGIRVYNALNGKTMTHFELITGEHARGLAFDPNNMLHVTTLSNLVEVFKADGTKVNEISFTGLTNGDGLAIDSDFNTIIADRLSSQVLIYNRFNVLIKQITGLGDPADVALGYRCRYLIVADYNTGVYLL